MVRHRGASSGSDRRHTCNQQTGAGPVIFSCYLNTHALFYTLWAPYSDFFIFITVESYFYTIPTRYISVFRRLDSNIGLLKGNVQRGQMALSRYSWLHEDIFAKAGHVVPAVYMPARSSIMAELSKVRAVVHQ